VCCKPFNADGHNIYQKLKETGVYGWLKNSNLKLESNVCDKQELMF
jgi:hypothetical protein